MRATLEQLKAMNDEDLMSHWQQGGFPFDLATCGYCMTQHHYQYPNCHDQLVKQVAPIGLTHEVGTHYGTWLRPHLEELYALRLYFDSIYLPEVAPVAEEKIIAELSPSPVNEGLLVAQKS